MDLESLKELKVECSYFNSGRERFNYILAKFIFNEIISVNSLVEELNVTRKTLDSDLRKIKKFIEGYGLKISTKLWNGTSIEGDFEDRYRLAVDFVASVSIFKELNSDFYRIFQLEKNNIVYRELRNHISRRENEEAEKFMLELFQELNYAGNIYFYYIGVAMVLVGKIYGVEIRGLGLSSERKELIRQESQKKEVKKTIEIIENILKNYPKLSFSREEIENFIYFMTFIDLKNRNITEETEKFIQEIEEYYDTISIPDLKANLQCMINYFKYKSKYNLTNYLPKIEHFPEKYREIAQEMRPIYQKYFGDIFEEDLYLLIHFYRDVIYKNHLEKNCKNVFIIDSTPNNHKGELVAEELEKNYLVGKIKIVSIFSKIDWEEVNRDYDMIFCLNDQDVSKYT
ncbi:MAG: helix-turn-helix domain-containing protein, partial [Cetobacterium sp.]